MTRRGCKSIEVVSEDTSATRQVALLAADVPVLDCEGVQIKRNEIRVRRPRQGGACGLALRRWEPLERDAFWQPHRAPSRKGTTWLDVLTTRVGYRRIAPGGE